MCMRTKLENGVLSNEQQPQCCEWLLNTVAKAHLFTAVFSQLTIFTADCLRHPIPMEGVETLLELTLEF